jgi:hypothetical protein
LIPAARGETRAAKGEGFLFVSFCRLGFPIIVKYDTSKFKLQIAM